MFFQKALQLPGSKAGFIGAFLRPFAASKPVVTKPKSVSLRPCATLAAEPKEAYHRLCELCKDIHQVNSVFYLVNWDERVMMPLEGTESRGRHKAILTSIIQEKATSQEFSDALEEAGENSANLNEYELANIRDAKRMFDRYSKVEPSLEREIAEKAVTARAKWVEAKEGNDYEIFKPFLKDLVRLHKERAKAINPEKDPYDTAIDMFERGMTADRLREIFGGLEMPLKQTIDEVLAMKEDCEREVHPVCKKGIHWNGTEAAQKELSEEIIQRFGYDMETGRVDTSGSAFAAPVGLKDVRVVTKFFPDQLYPGLRTTAHEAGHGMYEQGKNMEYEGLPVGQALSIGMHESQSYFWERMITRNLPFWNWSTERIGEKFSEIPVMFPLNQRVTADDWYFAINQVEKTCIRSEADELTNPLHIMLRFNVEQKMFEDTFNFDNLPELWNKEMHDLLGIEAPDDKEGCLQDVHWSINNIGYFPGYLIGAMTAAQLYAYMKQEMRDIEDQITNGSFDKIRGWLNENIHSVGTCYPSLDELLKNATGEKLNGEYYLEYLKDKYYKLYKNK